MSDKSDNACDLDADMSQEEMDANAVNYNEENVDIEIAMLMKRFVELCLQNTESGNNKVRQVVEHDQSLSTQSMEEKMKLLCALNTPMGSKLCTVVRIDNMHKQLLQQFHKLYNAEDECLRAYTAHCDEAIRAKEALADKPEFDEFTDMPYTMLMEILENMKLKHGSINAIYGNKATQLKSNDREKYAKYRAMLKETALFEKYELEAIESLEQRNFDLEKRSRALDQ